MNKKFEPSPKLKEWLTWLEMIHDEIQGLVVDANMFWEVQDIIRANPRIQKPSAFYRYLGRTYFFSCASRIAPPNQTAKGQYILCGIAA